MGLNHLRLGPWASSHTLSPHTACVCQQGWYLHPSRFGRTEGNDAYQVLGKWLACSPNSTLALLPLLEFHRDCRYTDAVSKQGSWTPGLSPVARPSTMINTSRSGPFQELPGHGDTSPQTVSHNPLSPSEAEGITEVRADGRPTSQALLTATRLPENPR